MFIHLLSNRWNRYLQAVNQGNGGLRAQEPGTIAEDWETFDLGNGAGNEIRGSLRHMQRITLKTLSGLYVSYGVNVDCRSDFLQPGIPQQFRIHRLAGDGDINDDDEVAFETEGKIWATSPGNHFPTYEKRWLTMLENGSIIANRTQRGSWEVFRLFRAPNLALELQPETLAFPDDTERTVNAIITLDREAPRRGLFVDIFVPEPRHPQITTSLTRAGEEPRTERIHIQRGPLTRNFQLIVFPLRACDANRLSTLPIHVRANAATKTHSADASLETNNIISEHFIVTIHKSMSFNSFLVGKIEINRDMGIPTDNPTIIHDNPNVIRSINVTGDLVNDEKAEFTINSGRARFPQCATITIRIPYSNGIQETRFGVRVGL